MNMTESQAEQVSVDCYPGKQLAAAREERGYSQEYVAGKLHLRTRVIELLETDAYDELPQTVFVQGYLRAYAKLLEIPIEELLNQYTKLRTPEHRVEKILRQQQKEPQYWDAAIRWMGGLGVFLLLVAVWAWWEHYSAAQLEQRLSKTQETKQVVVNAKPVDAPAFTAITDLSVMNTGGLSLKVPVVEPKDG